MNACARITLVTLSVSLLGSLAWWMRHPSEPVWHGQPLSAWLEVCYDNYGYEAQQNAQLNASRAKDPAAEESIKAIQQIGTNAVPPLLKLVAVEDAPFKSLLQRHSRMASHRWYWRLLVRADQPTFCRNKALLGFCALGAKGQSAVPKLIHILQVGKDPNCREAAADCLGYVGHEDQAALSTLVEKFKDPDRSVRDAAVRGLMLIAFDSTKNTFRPDCIEPPNRALERLLTNPTADADAILRGKIMLEKERRPIQDNRPDAITIDELSVLPGFNSEAITWPPKTD